MDYLKKSDRRHSRWSHSYLSIFIAIILFGFQALELQAEGGVRENYEETVASIVVPTTGQLIELRRYNNLYDTGLCIDIGGIFNTYYAHQGYRMYADGVLVSETPARDQRDNFEHCPGDTYGHNRETCSQIAQNLVITGPAVEARIRQYGGWCQQNSCNDCTNAGYYDETITLSYTLPASGWVCTPGSGPCCNESGQFRPGDWVCRSENQNQGCGCGGHQQRLHTQFCSGGAPTCNGGEVFGQWSNCTGEGGPNTPEVCNGLDDNCNGQIDEGSAGTCFDYNTCSNRPRSICESQCPNPPVELCDGRDNDCDGQIDEGFPQLNQPCFRGLGECRAMGVYTCNAAHTSVECNAPVIPPAAAEICNNDLDENCNGLADENPCTCINGDVQTCGPYTDVGACQFGQSTCVNGTFGPCVGAIYPTSETCDGIDNDCDGYTDEYLDRNCYEFSRNSCEANGWTYSSSIPGFPNPNVCCGNDPVEGPPFGAENALGDATCNDHRNNDCDYSPQYVDEHPCPVTCPNGLREGMCDVIQPYRCIYAGHPLVGEYQVNCAICGCPVGYTCVATGNCIENPSARINILDFSAEPSAIQPNQTINFRMRINLGSRLLQSTIRWTTFDSMPTRAQITAASYPNTLPVYLFDDGLHEDGGPGDNNFNGTFMTGFSQPGFYAFRVDATDINLNTDTEWSNFVNVQSDAVCEALFESGDPNEKMNFYFVPHSSGPGDAIGFEGDELQVFRDGVDEMWPPLRTWGVSSEYADKFNFYRINTPVDLDCTTVDDLTNCLPGTTCIDGRCGNNYCTSAACSRPNAQEAVINLCGTFKPRNGENGDKIVIVPNAGFRAFANIAAPFTHIPAIDPYAGEHIFPHEVGHLWGIKDYYSYTNTRGEFIDNVNCNTDERRHCGMCSQYNVAWRHYQCPLQWRENCQDRADVSDQRNRFCNDDFADDEAYLRDLLGNLP